MIWQFSVYEYVLNERLLRFFCIYVTVIVFASDVSNSTFIRSIYPGAMSHRIIRHVLQHVCVAFVRLLLIAIIENYYYSFQQRNVYTSVLCCFSQTRHMFVSFTVPMAKAERGCWCPASWSTPELSTPHRMHLWHFATLDSN